MKEMNFKKLKEEVLNFLDDSDICQESIPSTQKFIKRIKKNSNLEEDAKFAHGKSGIKISGQKSEVNDLLNMLNSKYGDLTIPEFIDMLIQKEKNGENVLDESLNEARENTVTSAILTAANKVFPEVESWHVEHPGEQIYVGIKNPLFIPVALSGRTDVQFALTFFSFDGLHPNDLTVRVAFDLQDLNNWTKTWYGVSTADMGPLRREIYDRLFNKIYQFLKDKGLEIDPNNKGYLDFDFKTILDDCDDLKETISNMKWLKSIFDELNVFVRNLVDEEKKNIEASNSSKEAAYQELKQTRKTAKENKNAKNTTIKQALSKSAVAKKIRELQNPTPEQLAKILAAIEGDN